MRSRLPPRRILFVRPLRPPNTPRPFTQNSLVSRSRPQVPFLYQRSTKIRPIARFLTTETKRWIKDEVRKGVKYGALAYVGTALLFLISFGVRQEFLEREFPSPHEWSWLLRKHYRDTKYSDRFYDSDDGIVDWASSGHAYLRLLEMLEDPAGEGAGLQEQDEGGILVEGVGKTGFDITGKSEPWRRGYYDILMGAARSAEYLDGWVEDRTTKISFPTNAVIGPSNPNPRPLPPGAASPPREEDCDIAFDPPEKFYMKILTTRGFTEKQRLDAALAYGTWLDYKAAPEAALETFKWAIDIASSSQPENIDRATGILNADAGPPSSNLLSATTALAVHHASHSNVAAALPIFLSVLRARRSLPGPSATMRSPLEQDGDDVDRGFWKPFFSLVKYAVTPPQYPPPPDDGTAPPQRDEKERCEEAGIMTYIGEILYASNQKKNSQEDGLAWTREAVDIAEEILRGKGLDKDGKSKCKDCLQVGLTNWATMVSRLAREEKSQTKGVTSSGWLGFRGNDHKEVVGRWESENHVVQERMRRVKELLDSTNTTRTWNISMLFM